MHGHRIKISEGQYNAYITEEGGATTMGTVGDFSYDAPAFLDPETAKRSEDMPSGALSVEISEAVTGDDIKRSSALYVYCLNDSKSGYCILAGKRIGPKSDEGGKYNPPMGHRHEGESPAEGAVRECMEESGVEIPLDLVQHGSEESWGDNMYAYLGGTVKDWPIGVGDEENEPFSWLELASVFGGDMDEEPWAWSCKDFAKKFAPDGAISVDVVDESISKAMSAGRCVIISESQLEAVLNEIDPSDISTTPFNAKNELNPKIWPHGKLNSRVRLRLMDIADDFVDTLKVTWVDPEDIVITGSIANYNWNKFSDIDIHVIMDYKKVFRRTDFVKEYFDAKKEEWAASHDGLKIYGFPVEMYVEDSNTPAESTGVYSLETNEWIKEPSEYKGNGLNAHYIKAKSAEIINKVDAIAGILEKETDAKRIETFTKKLARLFDRLKKMRKDGLTSKEKEMSSGNIIWKIVKHFGYIEKIWDLIDNGYDKINSIR